MWDFPKVRGTFFWGPYDTDPTTWGPYYKDPTIQGTIFGLIRAEHPHVVRRFLLEVRSLANFAIS